MSDEAEVERALREGHFADPHEHDVLAQALVERRLELAQEGGSSSDTELRFDTVSRPVAPPMVQLDLLGSFQLTIDCEPVPLPMNARRLVAFLALSDGFLLRRHIAGSLWGDSTERQAAGSLRSALWRLHDVASALIETADSQLRLLPSVRVDLTASETVARAILEGEADSTRGHLDVTFIAKDLLPDWTEDWALVRRDQHLQLRVRALEALCLQLSDQGHAGPAVHAGMLAVAAEPLRESAHRTLIVAHLTEGNLAAAAKQYETVRRLLWDELAIEPADETRALLGRLRRDT